MPEHVQVDLPADINWGLAHEQPKPTWALRLTRLWNRCAGGVDCACRIGAAAGASHLITCYAVPNLLTPAIMVSAASAGIPLATPLALGLSGAMTTAIATAWYKLRFSTASLTEKILMPAGLAAGLMVGTAPHVDHLRVMDQLAQALCITEPAKPRTPTREISVEDTVRELMKRGLSPSN
jgi:hypothetical protein